MYCVASKQGGNGLWELTVRNGEHNHPPSEASPKKKRGKNFAIQIEVRLLLSRLVETVPRHNSEMINLPLLQTPSHCIADFCLVPIGTGNPSVSHEIAEVQRILKRSGLHYEMGSSGTTIEGAWDDVMRIIGQAHSYVHSNGVHRIQTDIRVGSRTDKKQTPQDKVNAVNAHLNNQPMAHTQPQPNETMPGTADMTDNTPRGFRQSMPTNMDAVIAPNLDQMVGGGPPSHPMQIPPFHPHHHMAPHMEPPRLPSTTLSGYSNVGGLQNKA